MMEPRRPGISPTSKKLTAGSEIDAWCTRCRMDLGHRIVAMVGAAPKRVICLTCGSEHNFRAAAAAAGRSASAATKRTPAAQRADDRAKPRSASKLEQARAEWEARVQSGAPLQSYAPTQRFAVGDVLRHPKFGEGYVRSLISPNKLTIAFSNGERTLIHAPDP